jgi:hypothetical protein
VEFFQYVAPNFAYLNYRDFWHATAPVPPAWFGWALLYSVADVTVALFLTSWTFSKKEF